MSTSTTAEPHHTSLAPDVSALLATVRKRVLHMIEQGESLASMLSLLATTVESHSHGRSVASILLLDRDGLLRNGASPNLPANYVDAIDRLRPDPGVGTCAAAAATGQAVVTLSFSDDPRWAELRQLPLAQGFHSAWSVPIKSAQGKVLGTFGTFFRERRAPTDEERTVVSALALVAARAIAA